jgi:apolipoprotein N-acyltransferase
LIPPLQPASVSRIDDSRFSPARPAALTFQPITRLAEFCMLSHGWRRAVVLFGAGAVAGLSTAPLFVLPALFAGLTILVWCLDGAETAAGWRRVMGPAFSIGFSFGLGYFLVSVHWIGAAFFVEGAGWIVWIMPLALLALAAVLALFWGFGAALAHFFWTPGPSRLFALAASLTAAEWGRGHWFTGFPFDLVGYALTANDQMLQLASAIGVYGLTFVALLIASTPALIWPADDRHLTERLVPFFAALIVIAAQIGYGQYRLQSTETVARDDIRMRLVQPVIRQAQQWAPGAAELTIDRLLALSQTQTGPDNPGLIGVTHLVWPESAITFYLSEYPEALARIARTLPRGTLLLTGGPREDFEIGAAAGLGPVFNSILAINDQGEVVSSYDKTHLVPFGEYLPFGDLFGSAGIQQFVPGAAGWLAGDQRRLFAAPGTPPFLPLICYEAIFSGDVNSTGEDPAFILNVTNDGWYEGSIGPAKHFHHARLRSVEEGLSLVRAGNTGVTALIDPLGRVLSRLPESEIAVLDLAPPRPLATTFFRQWRHWPLLIIEIVLFGWLAYGRFYGRRGRKTH